MTNEQFEKQVAFIVGQQAQFTVDIQLLQEAQARTEQVIARTEQVAETALQAVAQTTEAVAQTADTVARLAEVTANFSEATHERFKDTDVKINVLIDSQMRTDEQIAALRNSQKLTDKTVRKLAATRDRPPRKRRSGQDN